MTVTRTCYAKIGINNKRNRNKRIYVSCGLRSIKFINTVCALGLGLNACGSNLSYNRINDGELLLNTLLLYVLFKALDIISNDVIMV